MVGNNANNMHYLNVRFVNLCSHSTWLLQELEEQKEFCQNASPV